jgi:hypothetical protein
VDAEQIRGLLNGKGKLPDSSFDYVAEYFNRYNSEHGLRVNRITSASDFKSYLQRFHPCLYRKVFKAPKNSQTSEAKLSDAPTDMRDFLASNITALADQLDAWVNGKWEILHQEDFVITVYSYRWCLKDKYHKPLVDEMGGMDNARTAQKLLNDAFKKFEEDYFANKIPSLPISISEGNDSMNYYKVTAQKLRVLAQYVQTSSSE